MSKVGFETLEFVLKELEAIPHDCPKEQGCSWCQALWETKRGLQELAIGTITDHQKPRGYPWQEDLLAGSCDLDD